MSDIPRPMHIGHAREIFAVYHAPRGPVRGAVLVCPPIAHELVNSYRLLNLVAVWLAEHGIACLRPDYRGSGDSAGADDVLTLSGALGDMREAATELRGISGCQSIAVLGVRVGALIAAKLAQHDTGIAALWFWQPVTDAAAWLDEVSELDRTTRSSTKFFHPIAPFPKPAVEGDLLGCTFSEQLRRELKQALPLGESLVTGPARLVVDTHDTLPGGTFVHLPAPIARWIREIELRTAFMSPDLHTVLEQLRNSYPDLAAAGIAT